MAIAVAYRFHARKTPTVYRFFACLLLMVSGLPRSARAQDAPSGLTEAEVVALALERVSVGEIVEGEIDAERGRARTARAYPNPQVTYMREQTFGDSGTGEDYLSVAQTIDLGGRRRLRGQAGDARTLAARHEGDAMRLEIAVDARRRFYEALYRGARVTALEEWVARVDEALAIVARRTEAGDAAEYDRLRLQREASAARGRLETERAAYERARARLEGITGGLAQDTQIAGDLLPDTGPSDLSSLRAVSASRPDLLALELRIDGASLDERSASRGRVPDLRLELGWKGVNLGPQGRTDGFQLGASFLFPLWDTSSGLRDTARGEARAARGRRALLEAELDGELRGVHAESVRLRAAAATSRGETIVASEGVVRIATSGYEGGELGLLELLDAYRGAVDDALATLEMELAARNARIELDRLTGAGVP